MTHTRSPDAPVLISPATSLNRAILTLALPAVVENLLQTVVFFSDTVMSPLQKGPIGRRFTLINADQADSHS